MTPLSSVQNVRTPPGLSEPFRQLESRLKSRTARVAILGLGYVGLPLLKAVLQAGFPAVGIDVNERKLEKIRQGRVEEYYLEGSVFIHALKDHRLELTRNPDILHACDVVVICVPTPLSKQREPDLTYVLEATSTVARHFHTPMLVILESTSYPGTTRELLHQKALQQGFQTGHDIALAFSPERIDPGNLVYTLESTPKVVGGITSACGYIARLFYESFIQDVVQVSSTDVAEMAKLLENTFRAINIGLVNEIALICERFGIDVWEVIEAAGTKPFGFMKFLPGPGLGGHCIPVDPLYLSWRAKSLNTVTRFIDLADEVNRQMPIHVAYQIVRILNTHHCAASKSNILILGVTYKKNVADVRESPAYEIASHLKEWGAQLAYYDPHIPVWHVKGETIPFVDLPADWRQLKRYDMVVLVTDHDDFPYDTILTHAVRIYDCRDALRKRGFHIDPKQVYVLGTPTAS